MNFVVALALLVVSYAEVDILALHVFLNCGISCIYLCIVFNVSIFSNYDVEVIYLPRVLTFCFHFLNISLHKEFLLIVLSYLFELCHITEPHLFLGRRKRRPLWGPKA